MGRLIYLSHTRSDIAYTVNMVSQFMHSLNEGHMDAGRDLVFSKNGHLNVKGYTYANWAYSIIDRRSTSGYLILWVVI